MKQAKWGRLLLTAALMATTGAAMAADKVDFGKREQFLLLQMVGILFFAAGIPLSALYGDRWGTRRTMIVASGLILAFGIVFAPLFQAGSPWLVLGFAAAAFVGAMLLVPLLGADLIPQLAQDRFEMTAKLPPGTPLAQTDALVREEVDALVDYAVEHFGTIDILVTVVGPADPRSGEFPAPWPLLACAVFATRLPPCAGRRAACHGR